MKVILTIIVIIFLATNLQAQSKSLLNMSNGDLYISDNRCCLTFYKTFPEFNDIAFGNDKIYAVNDSLHVIDFASKQVISSYLLQDVNGFPIYSDGLELVNDSLLFFDDDTDLYTLNLNTYDIQLRGNIGYYCSGDFLFLDNKLYMTTDSDELILINIDASYSIVDVSVIETISVGSVYGLSKITSSNEVILFSGFTMYTMSLPFTKYDKICELSNVINGATYLGESITENSFPNIITPNNDNINDYIDLSEASDFFVLNRWGEEVFSNESLNIWHGEDKNGNPLTEGVYFIIIRLKGCDETNIFCKNITIIR